MVGQAHPDVPGSLTPPSATAEVIDLARLPGVRRVLGWALMAAVGLVGVGSPTRAWATTSPTSTSTTLAPASSVPVASDDQGAPTPLPVTVTTVPGPLPTLPAQCTPPGAPAVVFVGQVTDWAGGVVRFGVLAIRSDPQGLLNVGQLVDVSLGSDVRFLLAHHDYLVAAQLDDAGHLRSKVSQPKAMFGSDQVVSLNNFGVKCPALSDPLVVRNADGSSIPTGMLSGLTSDKTGLAIAVIVPMVAVAAGFVALWLAKFVVVALAERASAPRTRRARL